MAILVNVARSVDAVRTQQEVLLYETALAGGGTFGTAAGGVGQADRTDAGGNDVIGRGPPRDQVNHAQADAELRLTNQIDGLWSRFSDAHPDLAKYKGLVNVAAQEVAESATAKGLDGEKFMFGAGSAQFLDEVAEKVNATIKSIKDGDEAGADPKKDPDNQPAPALGVLPGLPVASSGGGDDGVDKEPGSCGGGRVADTKKGQEVAGFFW